MMVNDKLKFLRKQLNEKSVEDWESATTQVKIWKGNGENIVFTNGCFDLLHPGHIHYIMEAASLGDRLVIGINTDKSVEGLKGRGRPINNLNNRMLMLAALDWTDLIVAFDQDTPEQLIKAIDPDILVKGGDYKIEEIAGAKYLLSKGGKVFSLGFTEGFSTSKTVEKIRNIRDD